MMDNKVSARTKHTYGWGCIGRDMCYTLVNSYFLLFLTDAIGLAAVALASIGVVIAVARIWDAINDPMMGTIVDNTRGRWGKFKPWILIGAISNAIVVILMFNHYVAEPSVQVAVYGILYFLWGMTYTMNDIAYWSMLPSLTVDITERSKVGTITNIAASIGQFSIIAGASPISNLISNKIAASSTEAISRGDALAKAFFIIAIVISIVFVLLSLMTVFGVKEKKNIITGAKSEKVPLKNMFKIIIKNDQLLVIAITYILFNIGYFTTTSMGVYYFNFAMQDYGVGTKFLYFSIILAVTTIVTMAFYPLLAKKFTRKKLFTIGIASVILGYLVMFSAGVFLPLNMVTLGISGVVLFFGSSTISMLIIMIFADTIEYGQWKLGNRNESINYSLRPLGVKFASAVSGLVLTITLVLSKLDAVSKTLSQLDQSASDYMEKVGIIVGSINPSQIMMLRTSITIFPIIIVLISYVIFIKYFKLDKDDYNKILKEIEDREKSKNENI